VTVEAVYKADVMNNISGGIERSSRYLDNLDMIFTFDGDKIIDVKGLSATVHLLNNFGGRPDADLVGSAQGITNIETPDSTGKVFQAFLQQNLAEDRISLLAGLYAVDFEFYITDSSGLFMHSTYGIGTDIAQSGQNGPSIFPYTSIADGVPGNPDHLRGTRIDFEKNDGVLMIGEAGYAPEGGKIGVGAWSYSEKFDHQTKIGAKERSQGAYLLGEKQLYTESEGQGLTGFARFGMADGSVNQFDYAWGAGLVYSGVFEGRDDGALGFAAHGAHNGKAFRQSANAAGAAVDHAETGFELTYSDKLTPWLSVQPDIQYI
jgi:porin